MAHFEDKAIIVAKLKALYPVFQQAIEGFIYHVLKPSGNLAEDSTKGGRGSLSCSFEKADNFMSRPQN